MERYGLSVRPGIDRSPRTLGVVAGDLAAIVLVLSAGMLRHGVNPLARPGHAAAVVAPFVLGWVLAAPAAGAYAREAREDLRASVGTAAVAWVVAAPVGAALRATPPLPGRSPPTFVLVVAGVGLAALVAWRAALAWFG